MSSPPVPNQLSSALGAGALIPLRRHLCSPGVGDASLGEESLVHVDGSLQAVLLQVLHLAHLFEDERLARLIALDLESRTVIPTVLHALESINQSIKDVATVLLRRGKDQ